MPASIGVRQSGLTEQSVLTFRVSDAHTNPVAGVAVTFSLNAVGGESITPPSGVTDASGQVSTTLTSGTRATAIRVTARADSDGNGSLDLAAQSTAVSILGAPPARNRFSIAPKQLNIAGRVAFGLQNEISVFVNDRFGNAVPPGTAVNFVTNGASVVGPSPTDTNGVAKATLLSEGEVPPTGIVTVMAFTRGEEGFLDNNGNGVFDDGIDTVSTDDVPEPYIDFRPLPVGLAALLGKPNDSACSVAAPSPFCNNAFDPAVHFEQFVDAGDLDGVWDTQGTTGVWDNEILVFASTPVTFSGPLITPLASPTSFTIPDGGSQVFTLEVHDDLINPLVGGSTIVVSASAGKVVGGTINVPDGESFNQLVNGLTRFSFVVTDDAPGQGDADQPVTITVAVTSQNGNGEFIVASGTLLKPLVRSDADSCSLVKLGHFPADAKCAPVGFCRPGHTCVQARRTFRKSISRDTPRPYLRLCLKLIVIGGGKGAGEARERHWT